MKSLLVLLRILIVGGLWSIVFIEGIRVIMLCNWHFDIFWPDHWRQAYTLWKAGWVVSTPKEWAFVLIIITFFPMLVTGWWTLTLVAWEKIIFDIITSPSILYRRFIKTSINVITTSNKYGVVKRKSYKQIRPAGVSVSRKPISDYGDQKPSSFAPAPIPQQASTFAKPAVNGNITAPSSNLPSTIDHALFKFDDDDDDFDLDIDSFEKSDFLNKPAAKKSASSRNSRPIEDADDDDDFDEPRKNKSSRNDNTKRQRKAASFDDDDEDFETEDKQSRKNKRSENKEKRNKNKNSRDNKSDSANENKNSNREARTSSKGPVFDVLQQKGYNVITDVSVSNTIIDFVGVSEDAICLCLVDKENGDWLADEELFNGEEPLWFSENSHRVSPVRKLDVAQNIIKDKIEQEGLELNVMSFVVVQMANIINADDMFEIWDGMNINVTRINRGAPKEIKLFAKTVKEAENPVSKESFADIRKLLKDLK